MKPEEFSPDSMPMLPEVASYVLKIALEEDVSVAKLAGLIEKDQTLTARILSVANSSYYKRSRTIYTVRDAAVVLGLDATKTLALGLCVLDIFPQSSDSIFDYTGFWRHCLGCAVYARSMMSVTNESLASKAFSAALLHDIGKMVINQAQPKQYAKILDLAKGGTKPLIEFEQENLGITHAEVGRRILDYWELPKIYTESAWCHHAPVKVIDDDQYLITGIVHIANILSHMTLIGSSGNYFPHKITNPLLRRFSLSSNMLDELMVSVPKEIDLICNEIGIGKHQQGLFTLINRASTRLSEVSMALHQKTVAADLAKRRSDILIRLMSEMNSSLKISDALEKSATVLFDEGLIKKFIGGVKIKKQNLVYEAKLSESSRFIKVGDEEIRSMILSGDCPVGMSLSSGVFVYVDPTDNEFVADEDFIQTLIDAISSALRKIYSESARSEEKTLLRQALEHASEEKIKSENLLDLTRELVDASTVALCLLDEKGKIAIENKMSHDIRSRLNMTRDNILASLEDGQGEYRRRLKAAILSRIEDDILWRDNEAIFHIKVHPVNFNNWLLIIIWDITREHENQRRMLAYAKMSAVGNLAASMAHNMKSPLGALQGFTSIIKGDLESGLIRVLRGDKQDEDFQDIIINMGTAVENVLS
ncbi:MAG: HDOD domain-containing protein, partial [Deltaproteobacteria bacterium]|nr:HDOD domain-containing protein [Deltaproteobacteria bacterium]